jgi:prepilin-type N-terminal cleavage/methylation domain-containing protein
MGSSMKGRLKKRNGFTLLEVMIAMVVLAIGILGIEQLYVIRIKGNAFSKRVVVVNNIAMDILEKAKNAPFYAFSNGAPTGTIPCQLAAPNATVVDCLRPDNTDATVPAAPYNTFQSDADYIWINTIPAYNQISNIQIKRVIAIQSILPAGVPPDPFQRMKTITVTVYWKEPLQPSNVHQIQFATTRDIGMM